MGQKPLTWAYVRRYVRQLRALLAGEVVEIEGANTQMIHPPGFIAGRPVAVPILIGANGPKGLEVARELGDGVMCLVAPQAGFDWCAVFTFGTVLDDGEDAASPRVLEAAGGGYAVYYHSWMVDALPRGADWRAMMEQFPADVRHLKTHELHMVGVNDHDRAFLDPAAIPQLTFTGAPDELRARLRAMEQGGATEVLYQPMGPDVPRELRAFAAMAELVPAAS
jgi:5,10-methylenetetrahydromethanopterin reductase